MRRLWHRLLVRLGLRHELTVVFYLDDSKYREALERCQERMDAWKEAAK